MCGKEKIHCYMVTSRATKHGKNGNNYVQIVYNTIGFLCCFNDRVLVTYFFLLRVCIHANWPIVLNKFLNNYCKNHKIIHGFSLFNTLYMHERLDGYY